MDVLRHDHVAHDDKLIAAPNLFKDFQEEVASRFCVQKRATLITTEGDEVEIASAVESPQSVGHSVDRTGMNTDSP